LLWALDSMAASAVKANDDTIAMAFIIVTLGWWARGWQLNHAGIAVLWQ